MNEDMMSVIDGTPGNDNLVGTPADDTISGAGGNDTIRGSGGIDVVDGGAGSNTLSFDMSGPFPVSMGPRTYTLTASRFSDSSGVVDTRFTNIEAVSLNLRLTGNHADTVDASGFVPTVGGGFVANNLELMLGTGANTVTGSAYKDQIFADAASSNTIDAGGGADQVFLTLNGSGTVSITESSGSVRITQGAGSSTVINNEFLSFDTANVASGLVFDASAAPMFMSITESVFADRIIGSAFGDQIYGRAGATGADTLTGGAGADNFFFWSGQIAGVDGTIITDFESVDRIRVDNNPAGGATPVTSFLGTAAFTGVAGQYRYSTASGQTFVQFDFNGDSVSDAALTLANDAFVLERVAGPQEILRATGLARTERIGTAGNDRLTGTNFNDSISGLGGRDTIVGGRGSDIVDGGEGTNLLEFDMGNGALFPAPTAARTYTIGASGISDSSGVINTSISNIESVSISTVGAGNFGDTFDASAFVPTVGMGAGPPLANVSLLLGTGNNSVLGSAYRDNIGVRGGASTIDGGAGSDSLAVELAASGAATLTLEGTQTVFTQGSFVARVSNIEEIFIGSTARTSGLQLDASASNTRIQITETLYDDKIIGSAASDFIYGSMTSGSGSDTLTGGGGADTFFFWSGMAAGIDGTVITDFETTDFLHLGGNTGAVAVTNFIGTAAFSGVAGQYRYFHQGGQTIVQFDFDGNGVANAQLTLANAEFILERTNVPQENLRATGVYTPPTPEPPPPPPPPPPPTTGTSGGDTLTGNVGQPDTLSGGSGGDTYVVDENDTVVDDGGDGVDVVEARGSFNVGNAQIEVIRSADPTSTAPSSLTGNFVDQQITGSNGSNVINGGTGSDTLAGLGGDDTYVVADSRAIVIEQPDLASAAIVRQGPASELVGDVVAAYAAAVVAPVSQGFDTVITSVSYTLAAGSSIEVLSTQTHAGTASINLTGNAFSQTLIGNYGDNFLFGGGGQDTLIGLNGNDVYIAGRETTIFDGVGGGSDIVYTSSSFALNGWAEIETISTQNHAGTDAISIRGNEFSQTLIGNYGSNALYGGGGADTLIGLNGDDIYVVSDANTQVVDGAGGGTDLGVVDKA